MKKFIKDLKILYIEDDRAARQSLVKLLSMFNIKNVEYVDNCFSGLVRFKANEYDLIISDIQTPIIDGIELAEEIRKENKDIPIIFTTGFSCEHYKESAEKLNASYLSKPIKIDTLIERISSII